jgi:alpha-tubulin suppressor-like RCC1 family protein
MHTARRSIPPSGRVTGAPPWRGVRRTLGAAALLLVALSVAGTGAGSAAPTAGPGTLLAFGFNQFGELGITAGTGTMGANPTPAPVALPGEVGPVTQVASGFEHSLAVTASGQLYAFGNNFFGQLGSSINTNSATPNPTPAPVVLPGEVGPVTQVAAGFLRSLALTASGQLYAFGSNISGQLGSDRNVTTANPNPTPALVVLPGKVGVITQIAAGGSHSLALTSSGQLYAFGSNGLGQLGTGADAAVPHSTPAPVTLPGEVGPVIQISAGDAHTLAVTASGQLYAFGDNDDGELGIGPLLESGDSDPLPTPTQVTLPGAVGPVTSVSGGAHHSLVLTASGQLYASAATPSASWAARSWDVMRRRRS